MAEESKLSKIEAEELRSLIRLLDKDITDVEFDNLLKSGTPAKELLKTLRAESINITTEIKGTVEAFNKIITEIKETNLGVNKTVSSFKGLTKIAEEIQYHQRGVTNLTEKDISKLQEKLSIKKIELENADKLLQASKQSLNFQKISNQRNLDSIEKQIKKLNEKGVVTEEDLKRATKLNELQKKYEKSLKDINIKLIKNEEAQNEIQGIIEGQDANYNMLQASLGRINNQLKSQQDLLGLSGSAINGLDTALNKLGFNKLSSALGISEAQSEMDSLAKKIVKDREEQISLEQEIKEEMKARARGEGKLSPEVLAEKYKQLNILKDQNAQYNGINGKFAVLKKGISSMGASLKKNLTDPLFLTTFFVTQLFDALGKADKATGELARQFGTSYAAASNIRQELNDIANSTGNVNITTEKLQKSLMAVNAAFGTNAKLSKEELLTFTRLTEEAGYTADELMGIYKISKVTGKSLDDNTKEILGTAAAFNGINKLAINEKEVLKEVNKASDSVKLSLKGSQTELAKAVMQAKQFGINLEQADKIAEGLLNFESSISSELEAELLTGKSLNFEKARLLALNNDIAGAAAEVLKQVKSSAEFGNMNRLQQEAIAKSVGMTKDELASSLIEREALAKLDVEGAKTAQEAYETLKKQGLSEQEIAKKLGETKYQEQLRSQSVQEKFNATVEKLKEIFVSIADPILEMVNALTPAFTVLGYISSAIGTILKFLTTIGDGIIPKVAGGLILLGLLAGGLGKSLLKGLVYPFKLAGQGLSTIGRGLSKLIPEGKGGILGKFKDKFGGSKADDLAGKAKDKADKTSSAAKGGDNAKGFAERMKNIAKGIAAFGNKEVLFGAFNLIPTSIGLIAMLPGFLGAKAIEKIDGKKLKSSLEGLAKGIEAFGSGKITGGAANLIAASVGLTSMLLGVLGAKAVEKLNGKKLKASLEGLAAGIEAFGSGKITGGSFNLIAASVGLTSMLPGVLGALAIQSIDGKAVKKSLEGLADGLEAMANGKAVLGALALIPVSLGLTSMLLGVLGAKAIEKIDGKGVKKGLEGLADGLEAMAKGKVLLGALALIPVSLGLIAMIPGFLGTKLIEKIDGKGVKKGLEGLADGLEAMAKGKVLLGAGALAIASIGLVTALPGMLAAAALGTIGPLVEKGLKSLASGIERLASGKVFLGALAIAALGASLIPAAYALKMFSDISWEDLGKAGAALVGLGVAGAVLGSFLPLMLMGAVAIAALGASLFPLALALNLAAPALDQFSEALSKIDGSKLFSAAAGIGALGLAMAAFGTGSLISGIGSAIGDFFGGDPTEKFNKLASIDGEKLKVTADSINTLGTAINSLDANKLGEVGDGFEKLSDSLSKSLLNSSIGDLLGAESPVSSMIAQLNELGLFDSTKILTIAEAITKLSESMVNLNSVTASIGDVSPIITTVDKVVELHDSLNKKNIIEETITNVTKGIGSLFTQSFSLVKSVSGLVSNNVLPQQSLTPPTFEEQTSTIQPVISNETSSLGKYTNTSTQNNTTTSNANNTTLDTTVIAEILKSIDMGIKNLNTKDSSITLTLDKDVIGSKITPVVNTFNNKTKSGVQL